MSGLGKLVVCAFGLVLGMLAMTWVLNPHYGEERAYKRDCIATFTHAEVDLPGCDHETKRRKMP